MTKTITEAELVEMCGRMEWEDVPRLIAEVRRLRAELGLNKCEGKYVLSNTLEWSKGGEYTCDACGRRKLFGHNASGELCLFEPATEADELRSKLAKVLEVGR